MAKKDLEYKVMQIAFLTRDITNFVSNVGLLRFELRSPAPEADMLTKLHYNPA